MRIRSVVASGVATAVLMLGVLAIGVPAAAGRGNTTFVITPVGDVEAGAFERAFSTLDGRVRDALGERVISIERDSLSILIEVQGPATAALEYLFVPGELQFRPVLAEIENVLPPTTGPDADIVAALNACGVSGIDELVRAGDDAVAVSTNAADAASCAVADAWDGFGQVLVGPIELTGDGVRDVTTRKQFGSYAVYLHLNKAGRSAFNRLAKANFHGQIAIVLDDIVLSAPIIQPASQTFEPFGREVGIAGSFRKAEAKRIARVVAYGALPFGIEVEVHDSSRLARAL